MNGLVHSSKLFCKRHASTILTCVGGAGVVLTAITAVNATPKALQKLDEAKKEKNEDLTRIEKFKIAAPTYIPSVVIGAGTLACIFGANVLNKRQQASLVSAYTLVESSFKEYKQKLKELYGEETHNNVINAIAVEKAKEVNISAENLCTNTCLTSIESTSEPVLFYDEWSHRYFEATVEQVIAAQYHTNRNFILRGYTTLNELYSFLGLETTDYGDAVGWTVEDELYWIDFNNNRIVMDNGIECYIIETPWRPSADFLEYY